MNILESRQWKKKNENLLFMEIICKRSNLRTFEHVLIWKNERYQNREYFLPIQPCAPPRFNVFIKRMARERNLFYVSLHDVLMLSGID